MRTPFNTPDTPHSLTTEDSPQLPESPANLFFREYQARLHFFSIKNLPPRDEKDTDKSWLLKVFQHGAYPKPSLFPLTQHDEGERTRRVLVKLGWIDEAGNILQKSPITTKEYWKYRQEIMSGRTSHEPLCSCCDESLKPQDDFDFDSSFCQ